MRGVLNNMGHRFPGKVRTRLISIVVCLFVVFGFISPMSVCIVNASGKMVRVGYYEQEVFQEGAQDDSIKRGYAYEYYQKLSELAWREDRENIIGYPDDAMGNETYSLVKHDVDADITLDMTTLNGRKIGVLDSAMVEVLQSFLNEHSIQAEVVKFRDYDPLFSAFDSHEIDILAAEGDGAYGRDHAELLCPFGTSDYYLCVSKTRPDLLAELNTAQTELSVNEPNYINSLRNKYYPVSISSRALSDAEKTWLSEHSELRIGYLNNYLPYSDTDSSGAVTGLVKDLVPRMVDDLGIDNITEWLGFISQEEAAKETAKETAKEAAKKTTGATAIYGLAITMTTSLRGLENWKGGLVICVITLAVCLSVVPTQTFSASVLVSNMLVRYILPLAIASCSRIRRNCRCSAHAALPMNR